MKKHLTKFKLLMRQFMTISWNLITQLPIATKPIQVNGRSEARLRFDISLYEAEHKRRII